MPQISPEVTIVSSVTPTVSTTAYSANMVVGGLLTFQVRFDPMYIPKNKLSLWLSSLWVTDSSNAKVPGSIYIFDSKPSVLADRATFTLTAGDLAFVRAMKTLDSYVTIGGSALSYTKLEFAVPINNMEFYGYFVASGAGTYTSTSALQMNMVSMVL